MPSSSDWFARRTWQEPPWTVDELVAAKAGRRVVGRAAGAGRGGDRRRDRRRHRPADPGPTPLVDELVVIDSGSTDRTVEVAAAAGARVVLRTDVLPELEPVPGKGEVLWRSLAATTGDVVCYLDSDLVDFDPAFVPALLGPLLTVPGVHLVKGFYRRPLRLETAEVDTGGGRVTELLVRPLLAALRPELAGIVQPLGGEYAGTRELLESLPFAAGYGVEIGLLLDTHAARGLDALAQVNLGVRKHRNRSLLQLGVMAGRSWPRCCSALAPASPGLRGGAGRSSCRSTTSGCPRATPRCGSSTGPRCGTSSARPASRLSRLSGRCGGMDSVVTALSYLLVAAVVAAALFGIAVVVFGRGEELPPLPPEPPRPGCPRSELDGEPRT